MELCELLFKSCSSSHEAVSCLWSNAFYAIESKRLSNKIWTLKSSWIFGTPTPGTSDATIRARWHLAWYACWSTVRWSVPIKMVTVKLQSYILSRCGHRWVIYQSFERRLIIQLAWMRVECCWLIAPCDWLSSSRALASSSYHCYCDMTRQTMMMSAIFNCQYLILSTLLTKSEENEVSFVHRDKYFLDPHKSSDLLNRQTSIIKLGVIRNQYFMIVNQDNQATRSPIWQITFQIISAIDYEHWPRNPLSAFSLSESLGQQSVSKGSSLSLSHSDDYHVIIRLAFYRAKFKG